MLPVGVKDPCIKHAELSPRDLRAWIGLSRQHRGKGQMKEAISALVNALRVDQRHLPSVQEPNPNPNPNPNSKAPSKRSGALYIVLSGR